MMDRLLTIAETRKLLNVSKSTLQRWDREKILTISGKKSPSCLQVGDELPFTANIFLFFENSNLLLTFF